MKKVYLIGNAHLDPVWLWRWQEGFAEIKATFRSALDRMNEFEDFKFTAAGSCYYMWIEKSDPKMFAEIQKRVAEGRWCIVGGWYLQPDCNIPSGESFARHALVSQRYFKEKFGVMAKTGYNVDSFGHNGNIPQLLQNSGMENYVFLRPMQQEKELKSSLFDWESMDGSKVRAYRIPQFYNIELCRMNVFEEIMNMPETHDMMAFYGIGNHGGGATYRLLEKMHQSLDENYIYSDPDEYFKAVDCCDVPTVYGDLQFHAKGCYSACAQIKMNNRKAENTVLNTEKYSVLSNYLMHTPYPAGELDRAWKNIMFNQFHDILGGCSIKEAYADAEYLHYEAISIGERNSNFALQQISWNIDTIGDSLDYFKPIYKNGASAVWLSEGNIGTPVVVFNPLAHSVKAVLSLREMPKRITTEDGKEVAIQTIRDSKTNCSDKYGKAFLAQVPAFGYTVYRLYYDKECRYENPFICSPYSIENAQIRIRFHQENGEVCSVFDKMKQVELLKGETRTILMDEREWDTWAHGAVRFKNVVCQCEKGSVKLVESGPVRATIRTEQIIGSSKIIRDYSITEQGNTITVKTRVDFREKHKMLKFSLPLNIENPEAYAEIPFGFLKREDNGNESVCGSWVALFENGTGIGMVNDSKHSFDADENVLSLTVLRGAIYADHYGQNERDEFCEYMEQGIHDFSYAFFPYQSIADTKRRAMELENPPTAIIETFHKGILKTSFSGISVSEENIVVSAIKKHEDSGAYVLRCYETENRDTDAKIKLFDTEFQAHFSHSCVKTLIVDAGRVVETNFLE